ncbi:PEP-CTERM sorting domain-containing protein [Roseiconus nitratireducens]|uniref:PEP-CTERM sorting domain-containing protein n=1 Tax=Roseiconus nitratireducens TaxID=2605748 RepID=A0A5M6D2W5_9BACT|nr:PEP-CTERM sorting domain-containing protein [Roseiconus nitratireducens]KAA5541857.1 PEP-CTERM sorting domain-containing protein [Roseiconus nitratireducens]
MNLPFQGPRANWKQSKVLTVGIVNKSLLCGVVLAASCVFAGQVSAGVMLSAANIIPTSTPPISPRNPGESGILDYLSGSTDPYNKITDLGTQLLKWTPGSNGGVGIGPLSGNYDLTDLVNSGLTQGTLSHDSGLIVDTEEPVFLIVKGGGTGFVVYDLSDTSPYGVGWNGTEPLTFNNEGLLGKQGQLQEISHIEIWGGSTTPPGGPTPAPNPAPEPTSLAVWGLAALGLAGVRRRRSVSRR